MFRTSRTLISRGFISPRAFKANSNNVNNIRAFGPIILGQRFNSTDSGNSTTNSVLHNIENIIDSEEKKFDDALGFDDGLASKQELLQATDLTSDQLGYLKSIGLVDGWWPSDIIQQALEYVHVFSGLPWWASIAVTTIGFRLLLFPLFMKSSDTMARSQHIMPQTKQLRKEMNQAMARGDQAVQQRKMLEIRLLNKKNGVKYSRMFLSPVTQMVYSVGSFFGIREMGNLPVQGFEDGGTLWFENLAAPDPYIGLHLISGCFYSIAFKFGGDTGTSQFSGNMKKVFMVLPFASIFFTWNMSAAVMVYLSANGVCSIFQSQLLRNPGFRKFAGMFPLPTKQQLEEQKQPGMMENFSDTWSEMKSNQKVRFEKDELARKGAELAKAQAKAGRVIIKKKK